MRVEVDAVDWRECLCGGSRGCRRGRWRGRWGLDRDRIANVVDEAFRAKSLAVELRHPTGSDEFFPENFDALRVGRLPLLEAPRRPQVSGVR